MCIEKTIKYLYLYFLDITIFDVIHMCSGIRNESKVPYQQQDLECLPDIVVCFAEIKRFKDIVDVNRIIEIFNFLFLYIWKKMFINSSRIMFILKTLAIQTFVCAKMDTSIVVICNEIYMSKEKR